MAKRCGSRNRPCNHPRARWWKKTIGVDWFDQGSGAEPPEPVETGFTFDTTNRINGSNQGAEVCLGDSMFGTTSLRPWPSIAVPQHPTPIDNTLYEFIFGTGVSEVTSELTGSLDGPNGSFPFRDRYPSNSQSQFPKYGNDFFTYTGIKPIILKCNIGGAEYFVNGDTNNWQASPTGVDYGYMIDSWNAFLATPGVGVTAPMYVRLMLGINDAAAAQGLGQSTQAIRFENIRLAITDLITRLQASFGADTQIRIQSIGTSGGVAAYTAAIAVRHLIEDAVADYDDPNVQIDVKPYQYFSSGLYGNVSTTSTTSVSIAGTTIPSTVNISVPAAGEFFFYVGQSIRIASAANSANRIDGSVLSYDSGTGALSFTATAKNGTGTLTDWNVTSFDDLIHWTQGANNRCGTEMALYEVTPRFDVNLLKGRFPTFTGIGAAGATLNYKLLINYKLTATATVHWAVYLSTDPLQSKADIEAGTGALAFGSSVTNCMVDETVSITGLSNNTRYRVQMWAEIGTVESDVYQTITFRTRASGNDTITNTVLARYSALDAPTILKITNFVEKCLDYGVWSGIDEVYWNAVNNTADKYVTMKGIIAPVNLGTDPAFVAGSGLRTTSTASGTDRLDLGVTNASFPQYLSNDGFFAINFWDDQNPVGSGTFRAAFGSLQGSNRSTRMGVTYTSASNKTVTYFISGGSTGLDFSMGSSNIELNKLHIVSKVATQSSTLDALYTVDGIVRNNSASANNTVANTANWYMFCQNNNGTLSGRCAMGINLLIVGGMSVMDRQLLTLAVKELGIGV